MAKEIQSVWATKFSKLSNATILQYAINFTTKHKIHQDNVHARNDVQVELVDLLNSVVAECKEYENKLQDAKDYPQHNPEYNPQTEDL